MPMTFSGYGHSWGKYPVDEVGCGCFNGMDGLTLEKVTMSFADEMRRKSLEAQSNAAEKARAEKAKALAKALALEESKRNNCIPNLKKDIQEAASKGLREVIIKRFDFRSETFNIKMELENLELNSFLQMYSSYLDEYARMRIAFIKSEPGLSLTRVVEINNINCIMRDDGTDFSCNITVFLKVVW